MVIEANMEQVLKVLQNYKKNEDVWKALRAGYRYALNSGNTEDDERQRVELSAFKDKKPEHEKYAQQVYQLDRNQIREERKNPRGLSDRFQKLKQEMCKDGILEDWIACDARGQPLISSKVDIVHAHHENHRTNKGYKMYTSVKKACSERELDKDEGDRTPLKCVRGVYKASGEDSTTEYMQEKMCAEDDLAAKLGYGRCSTYWETQADEFVTKFRDSRPDQDSSGGNDTHDPVVATMASLLEELANDPCGTKEYDASFKKIEDGFQNTGCVRRFAREIVKAVSLDTDYNAGGGIWDDIKDVMCSEEILEKARVWGNLCLENAN